MISQDNKSKSKSPKQFRRRMSQSIDILISNIGQVIKIYLFIYYNNIQDSSIRLNQLLGVNSIHYPNQDNFNLKEFKFRSAINQKDLDLKMLENLQPKKFDKNYVERFVTLLHESKQLSPKYSIQRKKLKLKPIKNIKRNKGGAGIYITLPKLDDNNNQIQNIYNEESNIPFPQYLIDEEQNKYDEQNNYSNSILTDTVRNILYKKNDNNTDTELYEEKEKILYEILKTRKKFHNNNNDNNGLYSQTDINEKSEDNIKNNKKRKKYLSPDFVRNFDENLSKSIEKKSFQKLTENQVKKLYYISELKLFDSFDELNKKNKILNTIKNNKNKRYLNDLDMFNYDKVKWDNKRKELNKNINNIMFNEFNSKNKKYLKDMRKSVDKLHDNALFIEKDMDKFLNDLNIFIDRNNEYIKENNQSNKDSLIHSKRTSFSKKPLKSLKNLLSINS